MSSQATFSTSTKRAVREKYANRCAICLTKLTEAGSQATHLFDSAKEGKRQPWPFTSKVWKVFCREWYECASCHLGLFTHGHIALSLPPPVLQYIKDYLTAAKPADRKSLYKKLLSLIRDAENPAAGSLSTVPILPYLGLYILVPLKPDELLGLKIPTPLLPDLSILQQGQFVPAPAGTSPTASNVARIFDALAVTDSQERPGVIPLSPPDAQQIERRYWRLPVSPEVVLSMLMYRISTLPPNSVCKEIELTQIIHSHLVLVFQGVDDISGQSGPGSDYKAGRKRKSKKRNDDRHPPKRGRPSQLGVGGSGNVRMAGYDAQDEIDSKSLYSDEEQEQDWEFGPSLSTNEIIFSARGVVLI